MIQSKYKYTSELGEKAGKLAYKLRSKKKDLLINIFVPVAILLTIGILIYDINKDANIILDVILLVLLTVIEIMNICMPLIISKSQKKYLNNIETQEYDYYISEYNKHIFKEKIYKDNKLVYANELSVEKLVNFTQFEHYLLLVFDNFTSLVFDLDSIVEGTKEDLLKTVANILSTNNLRKSKRK